MKRRMMGLGLLGTITLLSAGLATGCGSDPAAKPELGTLSLPLTTHGPSGAEYRLRDAVFQISPEYYYYGSAGEGGAGPQAITVSSEDDPTASSISVSVERGYQIVRLLPGWHLEKVEPSGSTSVEATLLSNETQWVYVYPHSSSWVEYQFGLGGRSIWFNGQLNIGVQVYEKPSDLYGGGGQGGDAGAPPVVFGGAEG
jgi:hypothetical protein